MYSVHTQSHTFKSVPFWVMEKKIINNNNEGEREKNLNNTSLL